MPLRPPVRVLEFGPGVARWRGIVRNGFGFRGLLQLPRVSSKRITAEGPRSKREFPGKELRL